MDGIQHDELHWVGDGPAAVSGWRAPDPVEETPVSTVIPVAGTRRVACYYDSKTRSILDKYGPGPRVHFCLGVFEGMGSPARDTEGIRRQLVGAQDALMGKVAQWWGARDWAGRDVLDCGCGLGGGSLYWATLGANVTAVTIAPEHVSIVRDFAADAGVADRVDVHLCDTCEVDGNGTHDVAVAMEASCYFPRERWFEKLAQVLRPGGRVCIEDAFVDDPAWKQPFDDYWRTDIGSVQEYIEAANAAGFDLVLEKDLTARSAAFWDYSMAWTRARQREEESLPLREVSRLSTSLEVHAQMADAWRSHGISLRALQFARPAH